MSLVVERFTPAAVTALREADAEARELRHAHVGVEHIVLGLIRERESAAARALESMGVTAEGFREWLLAISPRGEEGAPRLTDDREQASVLRILPRR